MNILYLAHRVPYPPNKGDKLRAFRQIEHLARHHRIWCACFLDTPSDEAFLDPLAAYCQEVAAVRLDRGRAVQRGLIGLLGGGTATESYLNEPAMGDVVRRWARTMTFDAVVAFSSGMAPYALQVPTRRRVLDLCDLDSRKWLDYAASSRGPWRWAYAAEGRRLAVRERSWIGVFNAAILITQAEVDALDRPLPMGKVHVVGNGVILPDRADQICRGQTAAGATLPGDDDRLEFRTQIDRRQSRTDDRPPNPEENHPAVGFVGVMDYRPNIDAVTWFARNCWERIRAANPRAVFRIIGRSPTRKVRRLARIRGVQVLGEVTDAGAEVDRLAVSVAPMQIARGLQNKVLEAMAAAKPVVLTPKAADGIGARDGREYVVAETAAEFAHEVTRLLTDWDLRARLGTAARRFVSANHRWETEMAKFERLVTGVGETLTVPVDTVRLAAKSTKSGLEKVSG